jgi:hypothetical protein
VAAAVLLPGVGTGLCACLHTLHALLVLHPIAQNEEDAYRKMKLRVEDVQGRNCLTQFYVSVVQQCVMPACGGG